MNRTITLRILVPGSVVFSETVTKVSIRTASGWWTFLPRHCPYLNIAEPGVVVAESDSGPFYVAVDSGIVTKKGDTVTVAVRAAVKGSDRDSMKEQVEKFFTEIDPREEQARSSAARLESQFLRWFSSESV